jgi:hypothetical protein
MAQVRQMMFTLIVGEVADQYDMGAWSSDASQGKQLRL